MRKHRVFEWNETDEKFIDAAFSGDLEKIKEMIEAGIDVNAEGLVHAMPALCWAAYKGFTEIVKVLLENGADVNKTGQMGDTALHFASARGALDIVKMLLKNGGDVYIKNEKGETALDIAKKFGRTDIEKVLIESGAKDESRRIRKRFEWYETELWDEETGEIRELEPEDIEEQLDSFGDFYHVDVIPEKIDLKKDLVEFVIPNKDGKKDEEGALHVTVVGNGIGYYFCEVDEVIDILKDFPRPEDYLDFVNPETAYERAVEEWQEDNPDFDWIQNLNDAKEVQKEVDAVKPVRVAQKKGIIQMSTPDSSQD